MHAPLQVIVPNNYAFKKRSDWKDWDDDFMRATLQYHILQDMVDMPSIPKGDSITYPTLLTNKTYTNITGGQHVILTKQPGGQVVLTSGLAERGTVEIEDVPYSGGLIQVVDTVMMVPKRLESTARDSYKEMTAFLGALYAADIVGEFADMPDVTLFIPRNAAFQHLAGAFAHMDDKTIRRILHYHLFFGGVHHTWELQNGTVLTSAEKNDVTVIRHNNYIFVNSAQIVTTDILLANGIVHIIDNVLSPMEPDARPNVTATAQPPVITPTGKTQVGTGVDVPFTTNLPCTAFCPEEPETSTSTQSTRRSTGTNVAPSRCTGMVNNVGLGLVIGAMAVAL